MIFEVRYCRVGLLSWSCIVVGIMRYVLKRQIKIDICDSINGYIFIMLMCIRAFYITGFAIEL